MGAAVHFGVEDLQWFATFLGLIRSIDLDEANRQ
jgi:hypothetical protein